MGKQILWPADRVQQDSTNRFVSDNQITNWDNKLENITITDWNSAITSGLYNSAIGGNNSPVSNVALAGIVTLAGNLIIQKVYPYDGNTDELIYYVRKGFIQNNDTIKWGKWFLVSLYLEDLTTYVIKGYNGSRNLFKNLIPSTVISIIFTDVNMPSNATLIDADDDGDGGVVAWLDTNDNTKMYVSTQKEGQKVIGNSDSKMMFFYCTGLTTLDVSNFNTINVTDMNMMFGNCKKLTSLDVSNFNTSNVANMNYMFGSCSGLTSLDVSNFDTSKVTYTNRMFSDCSGLTSLDVSNFDTSNVTGMVSMFSGCSGLTILDLSNFNTSNVTDMSSMFYNCKKLSSLDVSNFNTSKVTDMIGMFSGCSGLTTLDLSNFNTNNISTNSGDMDHMFNGCDNLTTIKVGNGFAWKIKHISDLGLSGTWQDETGTQYTASDYFPSGTAHTYTKVS